MPVRDISDITEDMIDTLLEEGFDSDAVYEATGNALSVYLWLFQEQFLGLTATSEEISNACDDEAYSIIDRIRLQKESIELLPKVPTRFERDPVI